jgi:signal transduction histidine kinase
VIPALIAYVSVTVAGGAALLAFTFPSFAHLGFLAITAWIVVSLLAESLWIPTVSGKAMESMASTVDISLLILLGMAPAVWVAAIGFTLANVFISRRVWYKAAFNAGQNVLSIGAAGVAFGALGGRPLDLDGHWTLSAPAMMLPWAAAIIVYFLTNTLLVSGAVALDSGRSLLRTWREEYLRAHSLLGSAALFFLSPLVVVSYLSIGYFGLIFFFVPLLLIKEAGAKNLALEKAKDELISSERLAAKGEMAAEVAHELNNYLAAISGRAQLLLMNLGSAEGNERLKENARIIFEQASNMGVLVKGLMDFSHKELRKQPTRLNDVVRRTVEFIVPQNKYERVAFDLDLAGDLPELNLDPAQIQQVLLNLFSNAADAMHGVEAKDRRIVVHTRTRSDGEIELVVEDTGPGIPASAMKRLFEPSFTTKPEGHGFGLSTCYRIVQNHGGRIAAENTGRTGARFTVVLPTREAA